MIRLISWNLAGRGANARSQIAALASRRPDILALQEGAETSTHLRPSSQTARWSRGRSGFGAQERGTSRAESGMAVARNGMRQSVPCWPGSGSLIWRTASELCMIMDAKNTAGIFEALASGLAGASISSLHLVGSELEAVSTCMSHVWATWATTRRSR